MILKMLLSTCHGCGDDLPDPGSSHLLCPRCLSEAVWRLNSSCPFARCAPPG